MSEINLSSKKSKIKGVVVSDKNDKTIVVQVEGFKTHKKYLKKIRTTKRYKVHNPNKKYVVGDIVEFVQSRPFSGDKKFIVVEN